MEGGQELVQKTIVSPGSYYVVYTGGKIKC